MSIFFSRIRFFKPLLCCTSKTTEIIRSDKQERTLLEDLRQLGQWRHILLVETLCRDPEAMLKSQVEESAKKLPVLRIYGSDLFMSKLIDRLCLRQSSRSDVT